MTDARYPTPSEIGAATALATMGALPIGQAPDDAASSGGSSPTAYAAGSVAGAAIGGGLVGLVASGDLSGAATGGLLTAGLASAAASFAIAKRAMTLQTAANAAEAQAPAQPSRALSIALGIGGLAGIGGAIYLMGRRRRNA